MKSNMKQCKCGKLLLHAEKKYKQEDECHECYFARPDRFQMTKGYISALVGMYVLEESLKTLELLGRVTK